MRTIKRTSRERRTLVPLAVLSCALALLAVHPRMAGTAAPEPYSVNVVHVEAITPAVAEKARTPRRTVARPLAAAAYKKPQVVTVLALLHRMLVSPLHAAPVVAEAVRIPGLLILPVEHPTAVLASPASWPQVAYLLHQCLLAPPCA